MNEPDLLVVSLAAFVAVLLVLAVLAGTIRVLMAVFPAPVEPVAGGDAARLAAIHAAALAAHPHARITRIEETR